MGFDLAPYSGAISSVSDLIGGVIKRIWPEKMSEKDRAELETAVRLELLKADWGNVEKEFQDRADARALAAQDVDKGNWFTNVLAATVRPVFGYVVMAAFFMSWVTPLIPHAPAIVISDIQKEIMLSIIYFFFGGRTVEKGLALWTGRQTSTK